ncbi:MAG: glycoside hydrolase family 3 protein [Lachnospirales bacterium]
MDNELKIKIGQMFMCGFNSHYINEHISSLVDQYYLGNIILFSRNLNDEKQVLKLNESLKTLIYTKTNIYPFISIDEEGGTVSRLRKVYGEFLGHYAIGALYDKDIAYNIAADVGHRLYNLGVNLNLAPVADINSNPENIGIGIRSFGENSEKVKDMAFSTIKGYESSNIIPTLKHFPGLGDLSVDSHHDLPVLNKSLDELKKQEILPFKYAIDNDLKSIMVSHVIVKELDENYPASMSKAVITNLLRKDLGYENLVITDCYEMGAIQKNYGIGEAVVIGINAGVDIFDISHTIEEQVKAFESVYKAVEDGVISEERINESYYRIIKMKNSISKDTNKPTKIDFEDIYLKVLQKNNFNKLNLDKNKTIALGVKQFVSNPAEDEILNPINISDIFEKVTNIKTIGFEKDIEDKDILELIHKTKDYNNILLFVGDMDIYKQQHKIYEMLKSKNIYLFDMRLNVAKLPFSPITYFSAYTYTNKSVEILCKYIKDFI